MHSRVEITKKAQKGLIKVPSRIKTKLLLWVDAVEHLGVYKMRCVPGYHDELLKGQREGQRSVYLRAIVPFIRWMKKTK